jgi:hypothetical protein
MKSFPLPFKGSFLRPLTAVSTLLAATGGTSAQDCSTQQATVAGLQSKIKADQDSIRKLNLGITASSLQEAVDAEEKGVKDALKASALALLDGVLSAPDGALGTKSIAGYQLKNGLGSIGPGQANTMIGMIETQGGVTQALIPAIRTLSQIGNKTSTLESLLSGYKVNRFN